MAQLLGSQGVSRPQERHPENPGHDQVTISFHSILIPYIHLQVSTADSQFPTGENHDGEAAGRCRGHYVRNFQKRAKKTAEKDKKELEKKFGKEKAKEMMNAKLKDIIHKRQEEVKEEYYEPPEDYDKEPEDATVVDDVFGYLDDVEDKSGQAGPNILKDLPKKKAKKGEVMIPVPTAPEDLEDLSEFSFKKFAVAFFQGQVTHQYSRRPLRQPLLHLNTPADRTAAIALWKTILRYLGNMHK